MNEYKTAQYRIDTRLFTDFHNNTSKTCRSWAHFSNPQLRILKKNNKSNNRIKIYISLVA